MRRSLLSGTVLRARARISVIVGAAVLAVGTLVAPAAAAPGDPGTIEAQIDAAWRKAEPVIEQYNLVHSQLMANKAKATALQKQLQPLQLQVDVALAKVSDIAVRVYENGPVSGFNAILTSGSPSTLVDQLAMLDQLAHLQEQQISNVATVRDKYLADKKQLDDLISQQATQEADLATKKAQIEAQIADLQKLRQQAYGSGTGSGVLRPVACPYEYIGGAAGKAVQTGCAQIGKPYVFGAAGPASFDCSGFTMYAWGAAGVSLYHYTGTQHNQTTRVALADRRPGDLIFYYGDLSHVALYVGGDWVVHAPEPGMPVQMAKLTAVGPINSVGRPG
jgi:peptidoglycan DL-endopeptidase CwlO